MMTVWRGEKTTGGGSGRSQRKHATYTCACVREGKGEGRMAVMGSEEWMELQ